MTLYVFLILFLFLFFLGYMPIWSSSTLTEWSIPKYAWEKQEITPEIQTRILNKVKQIESYNWPIAREWLYPNGADHLCYAVDIIRDGCDPTNYNNVYPVLTSTRHRPDWQDYYIKLTLDGLLLDYGFNPNIKGMGGRPDQIYHEPTTSNCFSYLGYEEYVHGSSCFGNPVRGNKCTEHNWNIYMKSYREFLEGIRARGGHTKYDSIYPSKPIIDDNDPNALF